LILVQVCSVWKYCSVPVMFCDSTLKGKDIAYGVKPCSLSASAEEREWTH